MTLYRRCSATSFAVCVCALSLLTPAVSLGQDWPAIIKKLEHGGSSRANKQQLSVAYNNYAIQLSNAGDWSEAALKLRKAISLDPRNNRFQRNLGTVYLEHAYALSKERRSSGAMLHRQAKSLATKALQYDPSLVAAHLLIGDIEYSNQQLWQARISWTKALKLDPKSSVVRERLERLKSEYAVEKKFDRAGSAYFDLRYQDNIDPTTASDLRSVLRQARKEVGGDFQYWPKHRIVVLIYSPEGFSKVRRGPDWAAGIYDGKIRVPYPDSEAARAGVRPTLYHEYTHALIHDLTGNRCPVWLNEGIAEFQEAKLRQGSIDLLRVAARIDRLIPLNQLDSGFASSDARTAGLAYQQSFSIVSYLADKQGFFRLRRLLQHLAQGDDLDAAFKKEYFVTTDQLESKWRRWLPSFVK